MLSWTRKIEQTRYLIFIFVAIGAVIRVISIPVFANVPHNPVDVYYAGRQASKLILDLKNPYSQDLVVHGYQMNFFAYLPMVAIYYAPFFLLGDIRFGSIVADILIMFSLYWIAKSINRALFVLADSGGLLTYKIF